MTNRFRKINSWTLACLAAQWDQLAPSRDAQLRSGKDLSFESVLKPTILGLVRKGSPTSVLDAGCGSGVLTELLADDIEGVTGVDMSAASIALASASATRRPNTHYVNDTIENFSASCDTRFSLVVANMVFQDSADLHGCLAAIAARCAPRATLVATITHPWFWPTYWGYDREPWFQYSLEHAIEAPFRISTDNDAAGLTTHFHRPLHCYTNALEDCGFRVVEMLEPMPSLTIQQQYPSVWLFPRFLAFRCLYNPSYS